MRNFFRVSIAYIFIFSVLFTNLLAQEKEGDLTIENALEFNLNDLKEDNKQKEVRNLYKANPAYDGGVNLEGIKPKTTLHNGEEVLHGKNYVKGVYQYGGKNIEYLQEASEYKFGQKHGASEEYFIYNDKRYLKKRMYYDGGKLHGKYTMYNPNNKVYIEGNYNQGIEDGYWRYFHDDGSLKYLYNYDKGWAERTHYASDLDAASHSRKGKKLSTTQFKMFANDKGHDWKEHGAYVWYGRNGEIIQEKYFYKGVEGTKDQVFGRLKNDDLEKERLKETAKQEVKEFFKMVFESRNPGYVDKMGEITDQDEKVAMRYLEEIVKQSCGMQYFKSLIKGVVSPSRSVGSILRNFVLGNYKGCNDSKHNQSMVTEFARTHKSEFIMRARNGYWEVE